MTKHDHLVHLEKSITQKVALQDENIQNASAKFDAAVRQSRDALISVFDAHSDQPSSGKKMLVRYATHLDVLLHNHKGMLDVTLDWLKQLKKALPEHSHDRTEGSRIGHTVSSRVVDEMKRLKNIEPRSSMRQFSAQMRSVFLASKLKYLQKASAQPDLQAFIASEHQQLSCESNLELIQSTESLQANLAKIQSEVLEPLWRKRADLTIEKRFYSALYLSETTRLQNIASTLASIKEHVVHIFAQISLVSTILCQDDALICARREAAQCCIDRLETLRATLKDTKVGIHN
eukprot:jgi/Hompol1/6979/HPOL_005136-RA